MHKIPTLTRRVYRVLRRLLRVKRKAPRSPILGDPILPVELERAIFEMVAHMHPAAIPALLRVARRVSVWIGPLFYRVVCVNRRDTSGALVWRLLNGMETETPPCTYVRHLALESWRHCSLFEARQLLQLCTHLQDFGANAYFTDPALLSILAEIGVRRLAVNPKALFGTAPIDLKHSVFRAVTHLDMFRVEGVAAVLADLPVLPALTHLSLDSDLSRALILAVLPALPQLELLLVQWHRFEQAEYEVARIPRVYDVRFVIGLYSDYWGDWEAGARGGVDVWARGDAFVLRKRRGEVECKVFSTPVSPRIVSHLVILATCYWLS
ncbi:hypothetical protein DFH08DRAFT_812155 [Mycena albidolilacea]|uniref:Uncharacterized protein n=1 Tax=Mycena albidolilacea TaxID=1033008 RepID=A0AAD6ZU30_9AGAR|nr:hypothetical protein DFH08DRAFT_812155 [Mycena albidolilacea]